MPKVLKVIDSKPQNLVFEVKSNNLSVLDIKPNNLMVVEAKPTNALVQDIKPDNFSIGFITERFYQVVLSAGQSMGLLLALTYPVNITVDSSYSP